jgi:hypothetical protein
VAKEIRTSTEIDGRRETVWRVLTNFEDYPNWNPFISRIDGELALGAMLIFTVATGPETTVTARARLLQVEENRRLVWGGSAALGLFRGEHRFVIDPAPRGIVLENSERFSGPVAAVMIRKTRLRAQRRAFEAVNRALKQRVEALEAASVPNARETS